MKYLAFFTLVFSAAAAFAQSGTTSLSQKTVFIGEKITLTYTVPLGKGEHVQFTPHQAFLPSHFGGKQGASPQNEGYPVEILTPFRDTILSENGKSLWLGMYEITAWDSGECVIESPVVILNTKQFTLPSISFTATLSPKKKDVQLYDIKESFTELPPETVPQRIRSFFTAYWQWLLIGTLLLAAVILFVILRKRKKVAAEQAIPFKQKALNDLDRLAAKRLWEQDNLKAHYSELSFILRWFLSHYYNAHFLEKTTHETHLLLQQLKVHPRIINTLLHFLKNADMVKFAKSSPDEATILAELESVRSFIHSTHQEETDA